MKKNNILKYLLPIVLAGLFTSCKDSLPQPDFSKGTPIIELPVASPAGDAGGNYMAEAIKSSTTPTDIYIIVNYAAPNPNTSDVNVNLAVDSVGANSVFGKYKAAHDTIPPLPADAFSLNNAVIIPKGVGKVEYHIKVNTAAIPDITKTYGLPLKIASASSGTISGNFGSVVLLVSIKNIYDGTYNVTGSFVDKLNNTIFDTNIYPLTVALKTVTSSSVEWYDTSHGYEHLINSANGLSYYGNFSPVFQFNLTNNTITAVTDHYGQGTNSSMRSARLDLSGVNASTGTPGEDGFSFNVSYVLVQSGGDRTFFTETFTYTGP